MLYLVVYVEIDDYKQQNASYLLPFIHRSALYFQCHYFTCMEPAELLP